MNSVIESKLQAFDSIISESAFEGRRSNSEQLEIGVLPIIPFIGWIKISDDDPLERVNSSNSCDSDDTINFEPVDHSSPSESININVWIVDSTHNRVSVVVVPLYDSSYTNFYDLIPSYNLNCSSDGFVE